MVGLSTEYIDFRLSSHNIMMLPPLSGDWPRLLNIHYSYDTYPYDTHRSAHVRRRSVMVKRLAVKGVKPVIPY